MERQLDAYCEHLRSERQLSSHTLIGYSHDLAKLLSFCTQEQIDRWEGAIFLMIYVAYIWYLIR